MESRPRSHRGYGRAWNFRRDGATPPGRLRNKRVKNLSLRGAALEYPLEVGGRSLAGVSLAVVVDAPIAAGTLEVELVALDGAVLRRAALAATELREEAPTRFRFDGVAPDRRGRLVLRVSAIGVDAPLRIFEWSRRGLRGLGPRHSRAFCGFEFAVPAGAGVKQAQERRGEV